MAPATAQDLRKNPASFEMQLASSETHEMQPLSYDKEASRKLSTVDDDDDKDDRTWWAKYHLEVKLALALLVPVYVEVRLRNTLT